MRYVYRGTTYERDVPAPVDDETYEYLMDARDEFGGMPFFEDAGEEAPRRPRISPPRKKAAAQEKDAPELSAEDL